MTTAGVGGHSSGYNPFGDRDHNYFPDTEDDYIIVDKKKGFDWAKAVIVLSIVLITAALIGNFLFSNARQKEALESMEAFNTSATDIHHTFTENTAINKFRTIENDGENSKEKREYAKIVASLGEELRGGPYDPITPDTSSDIASEIVLPYYAICDAVSAINPTGNIDSYNEQCSDFSSVALEMMGDVKNFNNIKNGFSGFLNPTLGDTLPDVTM